MEIDSNWHQLDKDAREEKHNKNKGENRNLLNTALFYVSCPLSKQFHLLFFLFFF